LVHNHAGHFLLVIFDESQFYALGRVEETRFRFRKKGFAKLYWFQAGENLTDELVSLAFESNSCGTRVFYIRGR
jgi:hypothetical protein